MTVGPAHHCLCVAGSPQEDSLYRGKVYQRHSVEDLRRIVCTEVRWIKDRIVCTEVRCIKDIVWRT